MFVGHQEVLTSIHQLLVVDWLNSLDRISKVQLNLFLIQTCWILKELFQNLNSSLI